MIEQAYDILYLSIIIALAICVFFCLIRAIMGPKTMDRIISINMIGSISILIIAVLSLYIEEDFLLDVDVIYAMLSFLAVVVLTKVYMGVHKEEEERERKRQEKERKKSKEEADQ